MGYDKGSFSMVGFPRARLASILTPLACLGLALLALPAHTAPPQNSAAPSPLTLYVSRFLDVTNSAGEVGKTGHAFPAMEKLLGLPSEAGILTAFEENRFFVYGEVNFRNSSTGSEWKRRVLFFKPSIFVVDDTGLTRGAKKPAAWQIYAPEAASTRGDRAVIRLGGREVGIETLLPDKAARHPLRCRGEGCQESPEPHLLEIVPPGNPKNAQFLHVLEISPASDKGAQAHSQLVNTDGQMQLTVTAGQHIFRWARPSTGDAPGEITSTTADAKAVVGTRPLPSGIMPHSPEGVRLLETWDGDYRDGRHPKWDTGQPSADLRKAVEEGVIKPGRVVEFGCGTGTDAIYMASRGFDVTAIDISPSAIAQALGKARKAGIAVRFMLADALNPPEIGKFDFIYDRACYHEVRGQNLEAYLETLRKASRPGTRMLLLAGNANGPDLGFGPPTVSEEELRFDFTPLFNIEWLRESRFEVYPPTAGFPLAWSVLMQRKAE